MVLAQFAFKDLKKSLVCIDCKDLKSECLPYWFAHPVDTRTTGVLTPILTHDLHL